MKPTIRLLLLATLPIVLLTQCHRVKKCPECMTPPPDIALQLLSTADASDLIGSGVYQPADIRLYYKANNVDSNIVDCEVVSADAKHYIVATAMAWQSANGIKTWYLKLSNADVDTLYVDVTRGSDECCSFYTMTALEYNGVDLTTGGGIYQIGK